jgi:hypothetical protein
MIKTVCEQRMEKLTVQTPRRQPIAKGGDDASICYRGEWRYWQPARSSQLSDSGHEVIGTYRSPPNGERVRAIGGKPIMLNLGDPSAVSKAVLESKARGDRPPSYRAARGLCSTTGFSR